MSDDETIAEVVPKLEPCECGRTPTILRRKRLRSGRFQVDEMWIECTPCGARGSTYHPDDEPTAIAAWNRRASGWQPIETAPRDGTWVLCAHDVAKWTRIGMQSKNFGPGWYYSATGFAATYKADVPTHWQPLPPAPEPTP